MLDVLSQILCWIRQFGAMVLNALVGVVNLGIGAIGGLAQAIVDGWPIDMPDTPSIPDELLTAYGWLKWSPLPVAAIASFVAFVITVWLAMIVIGPVLRWLKVTDSG